MFVTYPAQFYKIKNNDGYFVVFPDLGVTQGNDLNDAIFMAQDYIGTYLQDYYCEGKELPKSSGISELKIDYSIEYSEEYDFDNSFTSLVGLDLTQYVKDAQKIMIRRNVSIPMYLNEYAKREKINISKLLTFVLEDIFDETIKI